MQLMQHKWRSSYLEKKWKMWIGGGKKVIDRVWRKISFDCKSKPFFKNAHSNSQKLVKSLRVNHFDSTTSRFRTSKNLTKWVNVIQKKMKDQIQNGQLALIVRPGFSPELSFWLIDALSNGSAAFLTALEPGKMRCILAPSAITSSKGTPKNNGEINENLYEE